MENGGQGWLVIKTFLGENYSNRLFILHLMLNTQKFTEIWGRPHNFNPTAATSVSIKYAFFYYKYFPLGKIFMGLALSWIIGRPLSKSDIRASEPKFRSENCIPVIHNTDSISNITSTKFRCYNRDRYKIRCSLITTIVITGGEISFFRGL